jgi:hypothetical protein
MFESKKELDMSRRNFKQIATGVALLALALGATLINVKRTKASDDDDFDGDSRIQRGFEIAPVKLNLKGNNRALVGLGSYIVNTGGCNDCHSSATYATGGNPFLGEPKKINKDLYLGGGATFIPAHPPNFPAIISRNLTPDKTGAPEGGASFEEFRSIIRTGIDPDRAHLQYGPYLQVMPWPAFQDWTERDIRAVYEYLRAVPCVEGDPGLPNPRPIGTRCK